MESQPQSSEFGINPEKFHQCIYDFKGFIFHVNRLHRQFT